MASFISTSFPGGVRTFSFFVFGSEVRELLSSTIPQTFFSPGKPFPPLL